MNWIPTSGRDNLPTKKAWVLFLYNRAHALVGKKEDDAIFFFFLSLSPCLLVFVSLILDVPLDLGKEELGTESKTPLQNSVRNLNVAGMANVVVSTTRCA